MEYRDAVAERLGFREHVRGHENRGAAGPLLPQDVFHVGAADRIKPRHRLVPGEDCRLVPGRPAETPTPGHPPPELSGRPSAVHAKAPALPESLPAARRPP